MIDPSDDQLSETLEILAEKLGWPDVRVKSRLQGNRDRKVTHARQHVIIESLHGESRFVTLGSGLTDLTLGQEKLHRAYPGLTPALGDLLHLPELDVFIQNTITGEPIENLLNDLDSLPRALLAWERIQAEFENARVTSTPHEVRNEWETWTRRFTDLNGWTDSERKQLIDGILPAIRHDLIDQPALPSTRMGNGDLTTSNILVDHSAPPFLIDPEHAAETHFHFEDTLRFVAMSPTLNHHPGLAQYFLPSASESEIRFHLLKRIWLETSENNQAYQDRVIPSLKQAVWQGMLPASSADNQPELETAQLFFAQESGWSEGNSRRNSYIRGKSQLIAFPVIKPCTAFRLDPSSSEIPLTVKNIKVFEQTEDTIGFSPELEFINTKVSEYRGIYSLTPETADPQIHFHIAGDKIPRWVLVELESEQARS